MVEEDMNVKIKLIHFLFFIFLSNATAQSLAWGGLPPVELAPIPFQSRYLSQQKHGLGGSSGNDWFQLLIGWLYDAVGW